MVKTEIVVSHVPAKGYVCSKISEKGLPERHAKSIQVRWKQVLLNCDEA
jgi:hypothetical protein